MESTQSVGSTVPRAGHAPRAEAVVDLAAIRRNARALRERAGSAELMAVVKADGYGHGSVPVAEAALAGGATWLGVSYVDEALALRDAGLTGPRILSWLAAPGERFGEAIAADVDVAAYSNWQLTEIIEAAQSVGKPARLHLKVDTGLGRGGAASDDWPALVDAALSAHADGLAEIVGIWSHLACADEPGHPVTAAQRQAFEDAVDFAAKIGLTPQVRHLANSAALLTAPAETAYDLVRAGLAVYGLSPIPNAATADQLGLTPAMTLRARMALVKRVPSGTGVSYGHTYVTSDDTTLGLVPMGYEDGVPRNATNAGPIQAGGRRRTIAGTVCMDQFVVDLGDDAANAGDEVVLFGSGTSGEPTVQDWAEATGTISYEIVTRVGPRVTRTYREENT